ncbi:MAG: DUF3795 domain-containing protein [Eubacteriales bacterium]|nr:DUF3795 domain-containing protein [Eubacteriales bacterium]
MKAPETIDIGMLAPCGLNCMLCYRHLGKNLCPGCRARIEEPDSYRRKCVMRACTQERGFFTCADCTERPCKRMKAFQKRYREGYGVDLSRDAETIRREGADALLGDQLQRHTCPDCGHLINLHFGICSGCGRKYPIGKGRSTT